MLAYNQRIDVIRQTGSETVVKNSIALNLLQKHSYKLTWLQQHNCVLTICFYFMYLRLLCLVRFIL